MSGTDTMLEFLMKSLKVQSKEIALAVATQEASKLSRFFALQLDYKGTPVRLIVAASDVPPDWKT